MAEVRSTRGARPAGQPLSIVYTTARPEPRVDWLIAGLTAQAQPDDDVELVVVDALGRSAHQLGALPAGPVTRIVTSPPKPTPWQGPQRAASRDYWAASSARNTGAVLCSRDYVAFLDDRCRLGTRWLAAVREAAHLRLTIAGTYDRIDEGRRVVDHRRDRVPHGRVRCRGSWLYGANFALPIDTLLDVNGLEEGCDGGTSEDVILGRILENSGVPIWLSVDLDLVKERPQGTHHGMAACPEARTRAALARFGQRAHTELTPDLRELRQAIAAGEPFPDADEDTVDWWSGRRIRDAY